MKITGIDIGEYRQFKDIKFAFTYPEGHQKAGQPLEKICFIGQSGTGKTTLLKIIWEFFKIIDNAIQAKTLKSEIHKHGPTFYEHDIKIQTTINKETKNYSEADFSGYENSAIIRISDAINWISPFYDNISKKDKLCLFIEDNIANNTSELLYKQIKFTNDLFDDDTIRNNKEKQQKEHELIKRSKSVSVSYDFSRHFWQYILSDINNFDEELKQIALELFKLNSLTPNKLQNRINNWQSEHSNPRKILAQKCLNPILNKLHLELDVDETKDPVSIKTKSGTPINNDYLSTGTKQLLSTAVAVYKSNIDDGVILFDEPERSLFPDIQRELVDYYISLAPEAQFFFATHSPIIAASFEPEERFILYFDEDGNVKCRNGVAPIGDDPNDVLRQDFGMSPLMQDAGLKAYQRYVDLAAAIKNESNIDRKMALLGERTELGNRYNFPGVQ